MEVFVSEAIVIREYGGAEVLKPEPVQLSLPGPGEIALRQTAVGVNFHDVYVRSGLYKTLSLPGTPGCEATGIVEGVGDGVDHLAIGDRVAYVTKDYGAYASHRMLNAALAIPLPEGVFRRRKPGLTLARHPCNNPVRPESGTRNTDAQYVRCCANPRQKPRWRSS